MDYAALAAQYGGQSAPAAGNAPPATDYAALAAKFGGTTAKAEPAAAAPASAPAAPRSLLSRIFMRDPGTPEPPTMFSDPSAQVTPEATRAQAAGPAGLVVGATSDIGNSILNLGVGGYEKLRNALSAPTLAEVIAGKRSPSTVATWNADRNRSLNALMTMQDPAMQAAFDTSRVVGNGVATMPVGGAIANAVERIPGAAAAVPRLINAIRTSGASTGAAPVAADAALAARIATGAKDIALRSAGGGITGGATMALVSPEHTGAGVAVGAALPPALKVAGAIAEPIGNAVSNALMPRVVAGGRDIANALGLTTPEDLAAAAAQLRGAETLVPGASPTVAQAMQTPQASILQRVVHDSPGGTALQNKIVQQGQARLNALEGVAPIQTGGYPQAQADLGTTIERTMVPERRRLADINSLAFDQLDPAQVSRIGLPLNDMQGSIDKYLGPGSFGQGAKAREAMATANAIGTEQLPAISAVRGGGRQESLLDAVKRAGGISGDSVAAGLGGEVADLRQAGIGRVVNKNGLSLDRMTERMHEAGFLSQQDPVELLDLLRNNEASRTFSRGASADSIYRAAADAAMGGVPGAETIPRQVPWSELQNLRSSIGDAWKAASDKPGMSKEAAALNAMKRSLDETIMNAATGKGKPGDFMPPDVVARWLEANKSYAALMDRFHTGPQSGIFRMGGDGQPAKQGGEIAQAFWGNRPGLAEDVQSFRRLVDDSPALLGQFKSMITTHGAGTADAAGNLTTKFSKWVTQTLPGLRGAFSPEEVGTLQRIAQDIDRSAAANKLGTSLGGSNTFQNAANALDLGLLDSPALGKAASMVPGVRLLAAPALEGLRGMARNAKATRLAELLADNEAGANALDLFRQASQEPSKLNQLATNLTPSIYRGAPRSVRNGTP